MNTSIELLPCTSALKALLQQCGLDVSDIERSSNAIFLGKYNSERLTGVVGIELYGDTALLRSLAVTETMHHLGLGTALVKAAECHAAINGVRHLFLLTTTAVAFFKRLGYEHYPRLEAPASIAETSQFSELCPASSSFMYKSITLPKELGKTGSFR